MADLLKSKRLREERAPLAKQIQDLCDKSVAALSAGGEELAEDKAEWDRVNTAYDALTRSIELCELAERVAISQAPTEEREERREPAPKQKNKPLPGRGDFRADPDEDGDEERDAGPTEEDRALALQGWLRAQSDMDLTQRHRNACRTVGIDPNRRVFQVNLRKDWRSVVKEYRAQSTQVAATGGITIAEGFVNNLEMAMLAYGGMRAVADVMRTDSGNNMPWPTVNDTSNEGALLGENTSVGSAVDIPFDGVTFHAYKYSSKLVQIPAELMEDSAFNLAAEAGRLLGERLARITNRHFTVGTGAAQPKGIMPAATVGVTTASASAITADELLDLVHSVDPSYRNGAGFMMHDSTVLALRKLKDGEGQYLWQSGLQAGQADRLLGYPLTPNQHCATIAASALTIAFGLLSKYKIRDVAGLRLKRLVERYADTDQEGFIAFSRHDGNLLDAGTHPVKTLQMHA